MNKKFPSVYAEAIVASVLVVGFIVSLMAAKRRPVPGTTFYHVAKESIYARADRSKVAQFISPFELQLERINDRATNVYGWVVYTNANRPVNTQWFRCLVKDGQANDLNFFADPPPKFHHP